MLEAVGLVQVSYPYEAFRHIVSGVYAVLFLFGTVKEYLGTLFNSCVLNVENPDNISYVHRIVIPDVKIHCQFPP